MKTQQFNALEQKTNVNVKWWKEYGTPKSQESIESFISRVERNFSFNKFSVGQITKEEFKRELLKKIPSIANSKREPMSKAELEKNLETLEDIIDLHSSNGHDDEDKASFFSTTNNNREVFRFDYVNKRLIGFLFGVSEIENTKISPEIMEKLIKYRIDKRNIILLGGGNSAMDLLTDKQLSFSPNSVTNIDPFLLEEAVEKNSKNIYKSVLIKAEDTNLVSVLKEQNVPLADEIWASYSVPFYLGKEEEIRDLFKNIDAILAPGGIARIWPLELGDIKSKLFELDTFDERKKAWLDGVRSLTDTGRYNLDVLEGEVMHLQKLQ